MTLKKIAHWHPPYRTCDFIKVSKEQLLESSKMHIKDVQEGMKLLSDILQRNAVSHDYTKITHINLFHDDFKTGFRTISWWKMHQKRERHHFDTEKLIQDDVNLLDVLEQITDGVMAGMTRSGE